MRSTVPLVNIRLNIRPSLTMLAFIVVIHLAALAALFFTDLSRPMHLALSLAIVCYGSYSYSRFYLLQNSMSIRSLEIVGDAWHIRLCGDINTKIKVTPVDEMVVLRWFVALNLQAIDNGKKYPLLLFRDATGAKDHRHLRTWLKHGTLKSAELLGHPL